MSDDPIQTIPEKHGVTWLVQGWIFVAAPYVAIAAIWVGIGHWFPRVYNPGVFGIWLPSMGVWSVFRYRRYFCPERVPPVLSMDSQELAGLKRRKKLLGWATFLCIAFCVMVIAIASITGECKTAIPRTQYLLDLPAFGGYACAAWQWALDAYIKCRTPARSFNSRRPAVPYGKPFQSDHWGEPPQRL
jgi:hypothetical protein